VTTDALGDDYNEVQVGGRDYYRKEEADAVAYELNKKIGGMNLNETVERFSKTVTGTVNVNGEEFDYVATVSGNVVGTPQPHGEFHSEIDESSIDIDIEHVKPQPEDEQWKAIDSAVYDDVMGKNLWDLVNEIQSFTMPKPEVKPEKTINITGKKCIRCKKGTYGETSIHNDIEGTKSCSSCGHTLPTNATKDDLLEERSSDKRATVIFDIKMDNFFEENAIYKANDMVFQAIQSTIGDMLRNTYKVTNIEKEGEFRYFTFEVKLEDKKYIKPMIDALSQEYHVKKLSITKIF
jgi:hypothetical protein